MANILEFNRIMAESLMNEIMSAHKQRMHAPIATGATATLAAPSSSI